MEVGLGPGDLCSMGTQLSPEKIAHPSHAILVHVYCSQTAGWIKMPLRMEENVGQGDAVLDGVAASLKGAQPAAFGSCLLWPNGQMDEDATCYGSRVVDLGPGHIVVDGVPALRERGTAAPSFRPMSIVATVAHLSYC